MVTPAQVGALMARARKLIQAKRLTTYDFTVLDCLTFRCRVPNQARASVSYVKLAGLTGMAKGTIVKAIARFEELGLLRKIRQRVRVGWASRVATNGYELLAPAASEASPATESTGRPAVRELGRKAYTQRTAETPAPPNWRPEVPQTEVRAAQDMIAAVRNRRAAAIWAERSLQAVRRPGFAEAGG